MIPPDSYEEIVGIGEVKSQERNKEKAGRIVTKKSPPHSNYHIKIADPDTTLLIKFVASGRMVEFRNGFGVGEQSVVGSTKEGDGDLEVRGVVLRKKGVKTDRVGVRRSRHSGKRTNSKGDQTKGDRPYVRGRHL